jgi:hypothetical protein
MAICVRIVCSCSVCGKVAPEDMFTVEYAADVVDKMEGEHYPMPDGWLGDNRRLFCSEECYEKVHGDILHTGVWRA